MVGVYVHDVGKDTYLFYKYGGLQPFCCQYVRCVLSQFFFLFLQKTFGEYEIIFYFCSPTITFVTEKDVRKILNNIFKIAIPLLLAIVLLFYMYRDFDFAEAKRIFLHEMNVWWLVASLVPITLSHVMRGLRWLITLEPLGYSPKKRDAVDAIFIAYATNIVIPRVGEVSRCAVLSKYDKVPFSKALGTLVAERLVDMLLVLLFVLVMLLTQFDVFASLFMQTGTNEGALRALLSSPKTYVVAVTGIVLCVLLWKGIKRTKLYDSVKRTIHGFVDGLLSLRTMRRKGLFILYTIGIWVGYFLEFYLAFFCFPFTAELSVIQAMVIFAAISLAIIIPTPNGAGPWHFVVISMMVLYGVSQTGASSFALIVHAFQTLGVMCLGAYGWVALQMRNKTKINNR